MFIFKGISTKDIKIIVEEPENLIAKAPLKHEVLNIEGRDDAIYHPLGYTPIEISLTLQLLDPSKIDEVLMWLDGEGELIYKNRKTKARIFSEIQPIRTAGIRIINIAIIRAPFWYSIEDDYSEVREDNENSKIINEGTAPSKPIIKLTKLESDMCEFEVNGIYFKYNFNHDSEVLIDCEKMEASDNGQLRNRHLTIGYEFPVLDPGPNVVKRISGDAKIEFKRKDRWL